MKHLKSKLVGMSALAATLSASAFAFAEETDPGALSALPEKGLTGPLKVLALLTILSLLPAIVLTMTSFTRVVIVLAFVRTGIGSMRACYA